MDIVLDSNIFRSDVSLRSKDFDVLKDYLKKTSSLLIIPQIILDEVKGLYLRLLNERKSELSKSINNLNSVLIDNSIEDFKIDAKTELVKYENYIKQRLDITPENIIGYKNEFLPNIAQRAINRIKPSGEKGQGFRDTLIWLTLKDYCKNNSDKQIVFISNNTEDFANAKKNSLHETLSKECIEIGIKVHYYKSIRDFIESVSMKIDFINLEWINKNVDFELLKKTIIQNLNQTENPSIISKVEEEFGVKCDSYKATDLIFLDEKDFFVYEMLDNLLVVYFILRANVEFEFTLKYPEPISENNFIPFTSTKTLEMKFFGSATLVYNTIVETNITAKGILV
jgi:hypothetical protein